MLRLGLVVSALVCLVTADRLGTYNVDKSEISVSGISSGAAMAVQMHVAYSQTFKGVGSVAGLPYNCAQGVLTTALTTCMVSPTGINTNGLISDAMSKSSSGAIDNVSNMQNDKVFIWHGTADSTVNNGASDKIKEFYHRFVDGSDNIKLVKFNGAVHTFPTDNYGGSCTVQGSPFISNCNYNGAYEILNFIHGNLTKPSGNVQLKGEFIEFDQTEFISSSCSKSKRLLLSGGFDPSSYVNSVLKTYLPGYSGSTGVSGTSGTPSGSVPSTSSSSGSLTSGLLGGMNSILDFWKKLLPGGGSLPGVGGGLPGLPGVSGGAGAASMDSVGYVYIPSGCKDRQTKCKLHVALHGCKMGRAAIGDAFVKHAGYDEVAELNNIIVIYPLAVPDTLKGNMNGCWDWWGFSGSNYDVKSGIEMCAIKAMVDRITG